MVLRRMAWSASWVALFLALPVLADEQIALPALPDAAEVVITAADIAPGIGLSLAIPEPPEPAPVVLDGAVAPESGNVLAERPADQEAGKVPAETAAATPTAAPEAVVVTAAISSASPVLNGEPVTAELVIALPPPPDPAPVILDDVILARPAEGPVFAAPVPVRAEQADLSALLERALPDAVRQSWLPDSDQREIIAAYEARQYRPLWIGHDGFNQAGERLRGHLALASEDGLRPADYALPRLILPRPADLAAADIRLTALAVRYARDARGARIDPRRLSALITPKLSLPRASDVLGRLAAEGADAAAVLASYQPQHAGYQALRRKLAEHQSRRKAIDPDVPQVRIPVGPAIRVGMRDDRIVLIRARFGFAPDDTRVHDNRLATVVAGFQRENGLPVNGVLNRATVEMMNGGSHSAIEADLIANMERWRWLPVDMGEEYLVVNVPEYLVRKIEGGLVVHSARVVVGKTERPTPIFSDMMDHLVLNPSWTIPPTIMKQDILPKLASDPGYAERRGFQVIRRGNQISVRQPPGPTNALGNVKFMFPNDHAVYLHDTPSRSLFASSRRAYSSGCVRVERPLRLAELVLGGAENGWSERRLQGMVGSGERTIRLTRKLPIHIVYMTQVVDEAGELRSHEDIYGFHRRTREALGL